MIGSNEQYQQAILETKPTLAHINTILDTECSDEGRILLQALILHLVSLEAEKAVYEYRTQGKQ